MWCWPSSVISESKVALSSAPEEPAVPAAAWRPMDLVADRANATEAEPVNRGAERSFPSPSDTAQFPCVPVYYR